jgi:[acyl-carrier-protein] S-malonyltransferase
MAISFIFPGQGSQSIGMGAQLSIDFASARDVFARLDEALGQNLSRIMFEGPDDILTLTENAQPAIMAVSYALSCVLEFDFGVKPLIAKSMAGHSLGEYSAHCVAKSFTFEDTAKLLRTRGKAMQSCVLPGVGKMAALLGPKADLILAQAACDAAKDHGVVVVANDNNVGQIVISGHSEAVLAAIEAAKLLGAKASLLNVSAPFHCPLMMPAQTVMHEALSLVSMSDPVCPIVTNISGKNEIDKSILKSHLVSQVTGKVRWRESIEYMAQKENITRFIELGSAKVLTGMIKRIAPDADSFSLTNGVEIEAFAKTL